MGAAARRPGDAGADRRRRGDPRGDPARGRRRAPKAKHELLQSTIEIITGICGTVSEAKADLAGTLAEVSAAAERRGLGLMCAGTHPFTDWQTQLISPKERYLQ